MSFRALLALTLLSSLALADAPNISGKYLDVSGTAVEVKQEGTSVSIRLESLGKDLPQEVQSLLGEVTLRGPLTVQESGFSLDAKYQGDLTPNPHVKIKVKVDLAAQGSSAEQGLLMKACDYKLSVVIFSGGEIAGSETKSQKCVGLWKKQP